jgi:hypothetical protein
LARVNDGAGAALLVTFVGSIVMGNINIGTAAALHDGTNTGAKDGAVPHLA